MHHEFTTSSSATALAERPNSAITELDDTVEPSGSLSLSQAITLLAASTTVSTRVATLVLGVSERKLREMLDTGNVAFPIDWGEPDFESALPVRSHQSALIGRAVSDQCWEPQTRCEPTPRAQSLSEGALTGNFDQRIGIFPSGRC